MATLRDIRNRIKAVKSTAKITSAMKMVSAAKMKKATNSIHSARPYVNKLNYTVSNLITSVGDDYNNPLLSTSETIKQIGVIVISSDRGLCGSFNTILFKEFHQFESDLKSQHPNVEISVIPVGRKAVAYFKKNKYNVVKEFQNIFQTLNYSNALDIVNIAKSYFFEGKFDRIYIHYNEFVNVIKQLPKNSQLLPIEANKKAENESQIDYIFEPNKQGILDELLPKVVDIKLWSALLDSNAAEQAARMMAMDNATRNAKDLTKFLDLQYNKARQAAITTEMLEIVSGAEALRG